MGTLRLAIVMLGLALTPMAWAQEAAPPVVASQATVPPLSQPPTLSPAVASIDPDAPLYVILDHSGSMEKPYGNGTRLDAAKAIVQRVLGSHADGQVALSDFGGAMCVRSGDRPVGEAQTFGASNSAIVDLVNKLKPAGNTPLAESLDQAFREMQGREDGAILILTDGTDTCDRSACAVAQSWRDAGVTTPVVLQEIGMTAADGDALGCLQSSIASPTPPRKVEVPGSNDAQNAKGNLFLAASLAVLAIITLIAVTVRFGTRLIGKEQYNKDFRDYTIQTLKLPVVHTGFAGVCAIASFVAYDWNVAANTFTSPLGIAVLVPVLLGFFGWVSETAAGDRNEEQQVMQPPPPETSKTPQDDEFERDAKPIQDLKVELKKLLVGLDGRRLRKYDYYNYDKVVQNMIKDGVAPANAEAIKTVFEDWKKFKSGGGDASQRREVSQRAASELKKL